MDPVLNPYAPGAGRRPPELAGRDTEINGFDVLVQRCEAGKPDRSWILSGLRGVGKTVLLNEFLGLVEQRGWIAAKVEATAGQPILDRLTAALHRSLREATGRYGAARLRNLLSVFRSFTLKFHPDGSYGFGFDVDAAAGRADTGNLAIDLTELFAELGDTAANLGVGAAILLDEMQDVSTAELAWLNVAVHDAGQGSHPPRPLIVVGAGLPSLPTVLAEATTYSERLYEYLRLGPLDPDAARAALVVPAANLDVEWEAEALAVALAAANGYPFFIQEFGKHIWDYAKRSPIDAEDATVGADAARVQLDAGLHQARWERATPGERQLLAAVASFGEGATVPAADAAKELGKARNAISMPRESLIGKGILYAPERGLLAFTVPGMAEFIARQAPRTTAAKVRCGSSASASSRLRWGRLRCPPLPGLRPQLGHHLGEAVRPPGRWERSRRRPQPVRSAMRVNNRAGDPGHRCSRSSSRLRSRMASAPESRATCSCGLTTRHEPVLAFGWDPARRS